jgi:hypothetical protein
VSTFKGFVCDVCGNVWTLDKRTRVKMMFERNLLGPFTKDVCPNCLVPPTDGWHPTRKRRVGSRETAIEPSGDKGP